MKLIWHNGVFKNDEPVLTIHDRLRLGEGVFNTMLAIDGRIIHPELYFKKLLGNAKFFIRNWQEPSLESLNTAAHELLRLNGFTSGRHAVNTIISQGPSGGGIAPPQNPQVQILMRGLPVSENVLPIRAIIAHSVRRNEGSPLSQIKCSNYGDNILALREAMDNGANEAILLNNRGAVTCATVANVYIVRGGKLLTPPLSDGVQNGLTRTLMLARFDVTETHLTVSDLETAEGIYLVNSVRGAQAVETLNGAAVPKPSLFIDKDFHIL